MDRKNSLSNYEACSFCCYGLFEESKSNIKMKAQEKKCDPFLKLNNTPNPFNEATVISFYLVIESNVKIEIFDLAGKKVMDLCNQKMDAGKQTVLLYKYSNIGQLSVGNYIYEMTVTNENGSFKQCKLFSVM